MNFGGNEVVYDYSESGIIIVPVPYDETSTWMKGADKGPDAILEASVNLEFYDVETTSEAHLTGIHTINPVSEKETPGKLVNAVYDKVKSLLKERNSLLLLAVTIQFPLELLKLSQNVMKICQYFSLMLMLIFGRSMKGLSLIMHVPWPEHGNMHQ